MRMMILLAALIGFSALAEAQNVDVSIRGVRLSGTGCNSSSASAAITPDGKTLSLIFDNFMVDIGEGSSNPQATSLKKSCQVLIDVDVPDGYQYGLTETDYRGFAALPASAYGMHRFTQIIPNQPIPSAREAQLKGPVAADYAVAILQKPQRVVYSPCHQKAQTIQILAELQVAYYPNQSNRSIAQINLDSIDTGVNSTFKLNWKSCH